MQVSFTLESGGGANALAAETRDNSGAAGFVIEGETNVQKDDLFRATNATLRDRKNRVHTITFSSTKRATSRALAEAAAVAHGMLCGRGTVTLTLADATTKTATGAILHPPRVELMGLSWTAHYTITTPPLS